MYSFLPKAIKTADALASGKYGIPELTLMKNAARRSLDFIYPHIKQTSRITVLCGKGNNAGDGYEIAFLLLKKWYDVCVVNVLGAFPSSDSAKSCFSSYTDAGGTILGIDECNDRISCSDVIIDAIFGIGFCGNIETDSVCGDIIEKANRANAFRIAIDTPSGVNCNDGTISSATFRADLTVVISLIKTGLLSYPARECCGELKTADIGFPKELIAELERDALIPDDEYIKNTLPKRKRSSHKGDFGKLLMLCGSRLMTGAPYLCASAALRTGAGLITVAADEKTLGVLQARLTEPVFSLIENIGSEKSLDELIRLCDASSAVLIGCGLGKSPEITKTVLHIIKNTKSRLIIDADGINALSENINVVKEAKQTPILTPHPLEFSRITGKTTAEIQSSRITCAKEFSLKYSCVTVLKGAATVICGPDGRLAVNTTGNAGLAKGGSGDVLAGVVSSFVCQGLSAFDAAVSAVYLHGKAADILREQISEYGLLPSDLPLAIAKLLP